MRTRQRHTDWPTSSSKALRNKAPTAASRSASISMYHRRLKRIASRKLALTSRTISYYHPSSPLARERVATGNWAICSLSQTSNCTWASTWTKSNLHRRSCAAGKRRALVSRAAAPWIIRRQRLVAWKWQCWRSCRRRDPTTTMPSLFEGAHLNLAMVCSVRIRSQALAWSIPD